MQFNGLLLKTCHWFHTNRFASIRTWWQLRTWLWVACGL